MVAARFLCLRFLALSGVDFVTQIRKDAAHIFSPNQHSDLHSSVTLRFSRYSRFFSV